MAAILTLMIVLTLSLVVTRAATIALTATGMSREAARFQARSAFSGAGFTTTESESVVRHPVRRRIIMWLMLAGSAGIVAVIASVVIAATQSGDDLNALVQVSIVCGSIALLWWASRTRWVDERITWLAAAGLRRWTQLEVQDYATLLHVGGEYVVTEFQVEPDGWLATTSDHCRSARRVSSCSGSSGSTATTSVCLHATPSSKPATYWWSTAVATASRRSTSVRAG